MRFGTIFKVLGALAVLFAILVLRPIPKATMENSAHVEGVVTSVYQTGSPFDVGIDIEADSRFFYINRGAENGVNVKNFNDALNGQVIKLYYAKHWTPLDPKNQHRHVTRIEFGNQILYDEMD